MIVITTKRGRMAERAKINYRMQLGFSQIAYGNWDPDGHRRTHPVREGDRVHRRQELQRPGATRTGVNWLDEVFNDAALLQNYELSVWGATDKTNYYVSGGYYNQEGIAAGSAFERFSLRANVEQQAAKWLKLGTNTMMNYQTIERAESGEILARDPHLGRTFHDAVLESPPSRRLAGLDQGRHLERARARTRSNGWPTTRSPIRNTR